MELWVVKAITAKLIDCKMNQMNQVVIVRFVLSSLLSVVAVPDSVPLLHLFDFIYFIDNKWALFDLNLIMQPSY